MSNYREKQSIGLERYFVQIEHWLARPVRPEENLPLLIEAEEGVGKKLLIVKWVEFHSEQKP